MSDFNSVPNPDTGATLIAGPTLDGWTLVTAPEGNPGGVSGFEMWTQGDQQTNQAGVTQTLHSSWAGNSSWLELNDAAGSNNQTLGIERTVNRRRRCMSSLPSPARWDCGGAMARVLCRWRTHGSKTTTSGQSRSPGAGCFPVHWSGRVNDPSREQASSYGRWPRHDDRHLDFFETTPNTGLKPP
jgi:hypothetical protein